MPHGPQACAFGVATGFGFGMMYRVVFVTGFGIGAAAGGGCAKRGCSCTISMRSGMPFSWVVVAGGALRRSKSTCVSQPVAATTLVTHKARIFAGSFIGDTNARPERKLYSYSPNP